MRPSLSPGFTAALLGALGSIAACGQPDEGHPYQEMTQRAALCPGGSTVPGIDVSNYQGTINWSAVAGSGIKFAYTKATEGTDYKDPTFPPNWSGMNANGVLRGAYHFFHPGVDGKAQADYYVDYVGALGAGDLPPMLDWEVTDGVGGATAKANGQAFIDEIQARTGRSTIVYTSPGLWAGFGVSGMGANPLWVADYTYSLSSCPELPSGWSSFDMWQWSDRGSIPGIGGDVDVDIFNGDLSALQAFADGAASCGGALGHPVGKGGLINGPCGSGKPGTPTAPSGCGKLPSGTGLAPGASVTSCDGRFTLVMQGDGNVVEYEHGIALWNSHTAGTAGDVFDMQTDGNLVLYSSTSCAMWDSATPGNAGAWLAVQDDGNLVVYTAGGTAVWSSGSGPIPEVSPSCGAVPSGDGFGPGDSVTSCQGCFTLVMQGDGNLVLYKKGGTALWNTKTAGLGGYAAAMQSDGNLVLYSSGGCPMWDSNSGGNPGARLAVQDDGNLVVYTSANKAVWNSQTVSCAGGCSCLPPPPVDAGPPPVPDAGPPPAPDAGRPLEPVDAGREPEKDAGQPEPVDAGHSEDTDAGPGEEADAGRPEADADAGPAEAPDDAGEPDPVVDAGDPAPERADAGGQATAYPDAGMENHPDAGGTSSTPPGVGAFIDAGSPDAESPKEPAEAAHSGGCGSAGGGDACGALVLLLPLLVPRRRRAAA